MAHQVLVEGVFAGHQGRQGFLAGASGPPGLLAEGSQRAREM